MEVEVEGMQFEVEEVQFGIKGWRLTGYSLRLWGGG